MGQLYINNRAVTPIITKTKEVAKTKFGVSPDTFVGDVDENGVLKRTTWTGALNFAGVKEIADYGLYYSFNNCASITSVDLSSLQSVGYNGLCSAFGACTGITSVDLSSMQSVADYGMYGAFTSCAGITSVDLSSLQSVGRSGMYNAFNNCTGITSVDLSSLQSVADYGMVSAFSGSKIVTVSFPLLTDVQSDSFGSSLYNGTFYNCARLEEIHFRADMQATIEALAGHSSKFGATNATIYFDL